MTESQHGLGYCELAIFATDLSARCDPFEDGYCLPNAVDCTRGYTLVGFVPYAGTPGDSPQIMGHCESMTSDPVCNPGDGACYENGQGCREGFYLETKELTFDGFGICELAMFATPLA